MVEVHLSQALARCLFAPVVDVITLGWPKPNIYVLYTRYFLQKVHEISRHTRRECVCVCMCVCACVCVCT
jgi:hypothetical protein